MSRESMIVYLVRHADAGDSSAWRGADDERPLSTYGWRQAEGLVIRLEDFPVDQIVSSPALRCRQTVRPIAARNRLPVEEDDLLRVGANPDGLATIIHSGAASHALLCTHSELLADLLPMLTDGGAVVMDPLTWPKGAIWILHRAAGGPLRARFLPPLAWPVGPIRAHDDLDLWRRRRRRGRERAEARV
jgi:phosphohistidine phosphatase SixA